MVTGSFWQSATMAQCSNRPTPLIGQREHKPLPPRSLESFTMVTNSSALVLLRAVITSLDGTAWATHVFNTISNLKGVCATSGGLLFCGDNGTIIQSGAMREPRITSAKLSSLPFTFNVQGEINHVYTLQTSTDLTAWASLSSFTNISSVTQVSDTSSNSSAARFYRVLSPAAP